MAPEAGPGPLYACRQCGNEVRELDNDPPGTRLFEHVEKTRCEAGLLKFSATDFDKHYILRTKDIVAIPAKPKHAPTRKTNPVGVTPGKDRYESGVHEVPCSVNPIALLRVTGLAEKYLAQNPEIKKDFQDDIDACNRAGEIYNAVWEMVNRDRKP